MVSRMLMPEWSSAPGALAKLLSLPGSLAISSSVIAQLSLSALSSLVNNTETPGASGKRRGEIEQIK